MDTGNLDAARARMHEGGARAGAVGQQSAARGDRPSQDAKRAASLEIDAACAPAQKRGERRREANTRRLIDGVARLKGIIGLTLGRAVADLVEKVARRVDHRFDCTARTTRL